MFSSLAPKRKSNRQTNRGKNCAAVLKQNKRSVVDISSFCRIILDDVNDFHEGNAENNRPTTSDAQTNHQADEPDLVDLDGVNDFHQGNAENNRPSTSGAQTNHQADEPDLVEVVDVENYETNGLKARPRLNATQNFILKMKSMEEQIHALKERIVLLENGQTATTNSAIAENSQNGQQTGDEDGLITEDGDLDISALGSFIHDSSFTALASAIHVQEIQNLLQIDE